MSEPNGCPAPGACSALEQIAELTREREHWNEAYINTMAAADSIIEIERQRVRDALENSARLIDERNQLAHEFGSEHRLYLACKHDLAAARNEWRRIATDNLSALQTATARIAAAQAHIAWLRDALEQIAANPCLERDIYTIGVQRLARETLALPSDTSALDAQLKAAKVAVLREAALRMPGDYSHDALLRMADELEKSFNTGETT